MTPRSDSRFGVLAGPLQPLHVQPHAETDPDDLVDGVRDAVRVLAALRVGLQHGLAHLVTDAVQERLEVGGAHGASSPSSTTTFEIDESFTWAQTHIRNRDDDRGVAVAHLDPVALAEAEVGVDRGDQVVLVIAAGAGRRPRQAEPRRQAAEALRAGPWNAARARTRPVSGRLPGRLSRCPLAREASWDTQGGTPSRR